jgi:hypothetical protein
MEGRRKHARCETARCRALASRRNRTVRFAGEGTAPASSVSASFVLGGPEKLALMMASRFMDADRADLASAAEALLAVVGES